LISGVTVFLPEVAAVHQNQSNENQGEQAAAPKRLTCSPKK
jgi:hypothetical protein